MWRDFTDMCVCVCVWKCASVNLSTSWKWKWSHSVVSDFLRPHGLKPTRLLHPRNFPGKSTEVGCHFLLQGIFPTQGSNPGLPHCRQTLYHLSHQGSHFIYLSTSYVWEMSYSGWTIPLHLSLLKNLECDLSFIL